MTPQARTELESMQAAGASANEMWTTMQGNLGAFTGSMELQAGTWQGLLSTIKDNLMMAAAEGLKPFFDIAKQGLEGLAAWLSSPEVQAGIQNIAAQLTAFIQGIATFVQEHVIPFVTAHGPQLKAILIALAAAFGALLIVGAVASAIALLTNPITLIVAAIGILAAAWASNWGGIRDKVEAVVNFVRPLVEGFLGAIRGFWDAHGAGIIAAARGAWEGIKAAVEFVVRFITGLVSAQLAAIRGFWEAHGQGIVAAARQAWELIKGLIEGVVRHIQLIVDAFRLAFQGDWEGFGRKIFEIWQNAWRTVVEFISGLWDMVVPWLVSLWENVKAWFVGTDWKQLGLDVINGIVNGLASAGQAIIDTIVGFASAAWDQVKAFFGIKSPSTLMHWAGEMIGQGLIDGVRSMVAEAGDAAQSLADAVFEKLGQLSSIGGGFGGFFQRGTLDPLQAEIDRLGTEIGQFDESIRPLLGGLGLGEDLNAPELRMMLQHYADSQYSSFEQRVQAQLALGLLNDRQTLIVDQVRAQEELVRQQERMLALEKQRADIDFLKQQLDLMKMIKDNGLDTAILDGLQLGLNADAGGIMDAMTRAMRMMIQAAEDELGVHSPSRWAVGLMENVLGTMTATAERGEAELRRSIGKVMDGAFGQPALAGVENGVGRTDNSLRQVINGGVHYYGGNGRESALEEMEVLLR